MKFMQKKSFILIYGIMFLCSVVVYAQDRIVIQSSYYVVDSSYDINPDRQALELLGRYKPIVDERVSKKVGESAQAMAASMPESLLTNLACDVILKKGSEILEEPVDMSLLNIGGFRAVLPKGTVLLGDLYNIFPFDNTIQIACIKGRYLRQLFTMFVEKQMQPMSNVVLTIQNKQLQEALIGGQPLEDEKVYKLITIDYLILGGDDMTALTKAERYISTSFQLRDVVMEYIAEKYRHGLQVDATIDGHVIIIE
jgi:2',3'-cyclic-nucleotide 2'-phosphodiesterase (5'-nucleotidase family)